MRKWGVVLAGGAVAMLAIWFATPLVAQNAIRRSLHVSVVDHDGRVVSGLGPSDFIVREDKVTREVLRAVPADDPIQIAVLVDNSQAASGYVHDYREALTAFITAIAADKAATSPHSIALIALASRPTVSVNYTSDRNQLLKAAGGIFPIPDTGARLLDGIAETSEGITKRHSPRPVIVVITTQGPDMSDRGFPQVLDLLHESGAAMHVIAIGSPATAHPDRERVLDSGTHDSGGRYDILLTSRALTAALTQLAAELTHQYLVTYAHPDSLIPPEHVTVSAAKPDLTARGTLVKDQQN